MAKQCHRAAVSGTVTTFPPNPLGMLRLLLLHSLCLPACSLLIFCERLLFAPFISAQLLASFFLDCDWSWATFSGAVICLHAFFVRSHGLGSTVYWVSLPFLSPPPPPPLLSFSLVLSLEIPDNTRVLVQWCGSSNTQLEWNPSSLSLKFNAHFVMLLSLALCTYINIARDIGCPGSMQGKQMYKAEETQKEKSKWSGSLHCRKQ